MATLVEDFREPIRFMLGDHDDVVKVYEDAVIDRGVRLALKGGMVPGYALTSDLQRITPDIPDGADYLKVVAKVSLLFAQSAPDRMGIRTRGWSKSVGSFKDLLSRLDELIFALDNPGGGVGDSWMSYASFVVGFTGIRKEWGWLTRLNLGMPFETVSLSASGAEVS